MPTYTIDQYADINGWAGIDALGSSRRAKGVALQREKLRDECTLRDANDEVIPFVAFKRELVEGKLEPDPNDPDKKIWVPDRRAVIRNKMKHANSLTGEGGVKAVLVALGVTSIVA